VALKP